MKLEKSDVLPSLDPRLQALIERKRRGFIPRATASTDRGEIPVIARVADPAAWRALADIREGTELGPARDGGVLVTGRVPVDRIESLRQEPTVLSLKAATLLRPTLDATTRSMGARKTLLPAGARGAQGQGVVIGVIDFGCDFVHRNFRNPDGSTRLLALWDQDGTPRAKGRAGYGRVHERADIDKALRAKDPYAALRYEPEPGSHGTHVTDIAAGNGRGTGTPGVAPNADLVFVELSAGDLPWDGPDVVGRTFGDSVHLVEALKFIFDRAGERPCAVNISLGTNGGPHDGSTLVEQAIDALVAARPDRAVVIAASNAYADGIHASGVVRAGKTADVSWEISRGDDTSNEVELWYDGDDRFDVELIGPDGESAGRVALGESATARSKGRTVLFAAHRAKDPNNGDNVVNVFLDVGAPPGPWTLRLHGADVKDGRFHAWIERDDAGPSSFAARPLDNSHTLGSISCGHHSIVVGSFDAHRAAAPISFFSSAGPTRDGRHKPEVSAPGHQVVAASARSSDGAIAMSGTSMASPAVTGLAALVLAEARAAGRSLSIEELRAIVLSAVTPAGAAGWDARYGNGRVSARQAVEAVLAASGKRPAKRVTARRRVRAGQAREERQG
ncbi:S8 family peptidase [Anaeromyxobacter sp. Fw109-5]|uniref:S8 family peptidase n=1 Tax=Anaeromyxobacter sp. (strain Fw109-5) TaxID=404589 RepID=UPI0000ED8197|nr:S8 family peptidase [Anaeromyxobacter sp. Fw109-5]ABS26014.1 peptidase S8 and S53 subtilisin kexin sedolisin [Anaeromyxobacter sp. Fw109-5]